MPSSMATELIDDGSFLSGEENGRGKRIRKPKLLPEGAMRVRASSHSRSMRDTSRFKGVSYEAKKRKWKVRIRRNGKYTHIAYMSDEIDAAKLWDRVALQLHGIEIIDCLNFPEEARKFLELPDDFDALDHAATPAAERARKKILEMSGIVPGSGEQDGAGDDDESESEGEEAADAAAVPKPVATEEAGHSERSDGSTLLHPDGTAQGESSPKNGEVTDRSVPPVPGDDTSELLSRRAVDYLRRMQKMDSAGTTEHGSSRSKSENSWNDGEIDDDSVSNKKNRRSPAETKHPYKVMVPPMRLPPHQPYNSHSGQYSNGEAPYSSTLRIRLKPGTNGGAPRAFIVTPPSEEAYGLPPIWPDAYSGQKRPRYMYDNGMPYPQHVAQQQYMPPYGAPGSMMPMSSHRDSPYSFFPGMMRPEEHGAVQGSSAYPHFAGDMPGFNMPNAWKQSNYMMMPPPYPTMPAGIPNSARQYDAGYGQNPYSQQMPPFLAYSGALPPASTFLKQPEGPISKASSSSATESPRTLTISEGRADAPHYPGDAAPSASPSREPAFAYPFRADYANMQEPPGSLTARLVGGIGFSPYAAMPYADMHRYNYGMPHPDSHRSEENPAAFFAEPPGSARVPGPAYESAVPVRLTGHGSEGPQRATDHASV